MVSRRIRISEEDTESAPLIEKIVDGNGDPFPVVDGASGKALQISAGSGGSGAEKVLSILSENQLKQDESENFGNRLKAAMILIISSVDLNSGDTLVFNSPAIEDKIFTFIPSSENSGPLQIPLEIERDDNQVATTVADWIAGSFIDGDTGLPKFRGEVKQLIFDKTANNPKYVVIITENFDSTDMQSKFYAVTSNPDAIKTINFNNGSYDNDTVVACPTTLEAAFNFGTKGIHSPNEIFLERFTGKSFIYNQDTAQFQELDKIAKDLINGLDTRVGNVETAVNSLNLLNSRAGETPLMSQSDAHTRWQNDPRSQTDPYVNIGFMYQDVGTYNLMWLEAYSGQSFIIGTVSPGGG